MLENQQECVYVTHHCAPEVATMADQLIEMAGWGRVSAHIGTSANCLCVNDLREGKK